MRPLPSPAWVTKRGCTRSVANSSSSRVTPSGSKASLAAGASVEATDGVAPAVAGTVATVARTVGSLAAAGSVATGVVAPTTVAAGVGSTGDVAAPPGTVVSATSSPIEAAVSSSGGVVACGPGAASPTVLSGGDPDGWTVGEPSPPHPAKASPAQIARAASRIPLNRKCISIPFQQPEQAPGQIRSRRDAMRPREGVLVYTRRCCLHPTAL